MTPRGASSADGYIHRVRNAMFGVEDLEECLLCDAEDMAGSIARADLTKPTARDWKVPGKILD